MRKNPAAQSGLFDPRVLVAFFLCSVSALLALLSFAGASENRVMVATIQPCISLGTRVTVSVAASGYDASGCLPLNEAGLPRLMAGQLGGDAARAVSSSLGNISTIAGAVGTGFGPALGQVPASITYANGSLYISDWAYYNVVRRLDLSTGQETVVAGVGSYGFNGDGPAAAVEMELPWGVVVDSRGNLYIADSANQRVRRVDSSGELVTVAGGGTSQASGIPGTSEYIGGPMGLAIDNQGNLLIADEITMRILKLDLTSGIITVVAGTGSFGYNGDNQPATSAQLGLPQGVAVDRANNIYIADTSNQRIRKVDVTGTITTIAGNGMGGYSGDGGPAVVAQINNPSQLSFDPTGNLNFTDTNNGRVRKIDIFGIITTVAGGGSTIPANGVPALSARFNTPFYGVTIGPDGTLFIADTNGSKVWRVDGTGSLVTVAGNGTLGESGNGGPATLAQTFQADSVAFDSAGNYYVADWVMSVIRKVSPDGTITTVAGLVGGNQYSPTGYRGYNGDEIPATQARLHSPAGMAVDGAGNLYVADSFNNRIRKIDTRGVIHTVAGNGTAGYSGDAGPATQAELDQPNGVAVDSKGNIYIADTGTTSLPPGGNRIRKVSADGTISTIAGTGIGGYNADGIPAIIAEVNGPNGVAVDGADNLYVADTFNSRIRKIDMSAVTPIITTVAGNGTAGVSGDGGAATSAKLNFPTGVSVDGKGDIAIADPSSQRGRFVNTSGNISTIAGNGTPGLSGDGGPGTAAMLSYPGGIAFDSAGNAFIADGTYPFGNNRVRKVTLVPPVQLIGVVSRKIHGSAGAFDIDLPLTGPRGIECRSGGATNDYTMIFTFATTLTSVGSASASSGSVSGSMIGSDAHQYVVNLTGVTTGQYVTVTLVNVHDSSGNISSAVSASMGVLVGDVNASGIVTSGDTNLCKAQALQPVTNANFRNDINASGAITTGDVNIIKQNALTQLPSPP